MVVTLQRNNLYTYYILGMAAKQKKYSYDDLMKLLDTSEEGFIDIYFFREIARDCIFRTDENGKDPIKFYAVTRDTNNDIIGYKWISYDALCKRYKYYHEKHDCYKNDTLRNMIHNYVSCTSMKNYKEFGKQLIYSNSND